MPLPRAVHKAVGGMFRLQVYYPDDHLPREVHDVGRATEVLDRIPELLDRHPDCHRVVVISDDTTLFAVDCRGARIAI